MGRKNTNKKSQNSTSKDQEKTDEIEETTEATEAIESIDSSANNKKDLESQETKSEIPIGSEEIKTEDTKVENNDAHVKNLKAGETFDDSKAISVTSDYHGIESSKSSEVAPTVQNQVKTADDRHLDKHNDVHVEKGKPDERKEELSELKDEPKEEHKKLHEEVKVEHPEPKETHHDHEEQMVEVLEEPDHKEPEKSDLSENRFIEFNIHYLTNFGEKIVLVGSTSALGNWELNRGIELEWSEENIWKARVELPVEHSEYKYICVSSESVRWEEGENHSINFENPVQNNLWQ